MTPITDQNTQLKYLLQLSKNLAGVDALELPESGEQCFLNGAMNFCWEMHPQKGNSLVKQITLKFCTGATNITCKVPLDTLNINSLGLIATDNNGVAYLCRQKLTNSNRTGLDPHENFEIEWAGPTYSSFSVEGKSSSRFYYAIVPISVAAETSIESVMCLLDGISQAKA